MIEKTANPLETIIDFAWSTGADMFWVNNAKDELKKLKEKQKLIESLAEPVAWAKINSHGDLYDLNLQNNPYYDQSKMVPLYRITYEQ